MVVKAVVFDLDGTLASFNLDYMNARAEVRGLLIKKGLPASILSTNESIFDMLKKSEIFLKNNRKPSLTIEGIRNSALTIAEKHELEAAKTTSLLPGVVETLQSLRKMDLKIGLCTINGERSTSLILKRFDITSYFDVLTPRDKVRYVKPNPEHLEITLRDLGFSADQSMLVGDGDRDMICAREVGVIAVGLMTEASSKKELIASGANYVITSIADTPLLIEKINRT